MWVIVGQLLAFDYGVCTQSEIAVRPRRRLNQLCFACQAKTLTSLIIDWIFAPQPIGKRRPTSTMQPKNILYAEDDPNDVVIFKMAFKRATLQHSLYVVENGEAAIDWLSGKGNYSDRKNHPVPDVLILDLKMPKKSGFDVLDWARRQKEFADTTIFILSSSDEPSDVKRAYALGATTYFVKSASYSDVIQYLRLLP
jgi:CheY-like chemotaxis protein